MTSPIAERTCRYVDARVQSCTQLCREHVAIELAPAAFPPSDPGQFLQLLCSDEHSSRGAEREWRRDGFPSPTDADFLKPRPYLRRPFSLADHWTAPDGGPRLLVISRSVGVGTRRLASLVAGDLLNIAGPLGHGFRTPPLDTPVALVGGGVGIPPLLYFARRLHELGHRHVTVIFGALSRDLLPLTLRSEPQEHATTCVALPGDVPYRAIITTDDGSCGLHGRVTRGLRRWYDELRSGGGAPPKVYACGPEAMLRAVADLTRELKLACQLCIERNMGCGLGTCLSCIVRVRAAERPTGWRWGLACTDGPVFDRDDLLDYAPGAGA